MTSVHVITASPCDSCRDWEVAGWLQVAVPRLGEDRVRDTIGAGDSFIAGFLHSASAQPDLGTAVRAGVMNGAGLQ